jgi:DNA gyrase/topoisomerase IV subunit A
MQGTFGINILALVNGQPQKLNLKQALKVFVDHRLEVVKRRSEYELRKAEERLHILNAYLIALENLDEVILSFDALKGLKLLAITSCAGLTWTKCRLRPS